MHTIWQVEIWSQEECSGRFFLIPAYVIILEFPSFFHSFITQTTFVFQCTTKREFERCASNTSSIEIRRSTGVAVVVIAHRLRWTLWCLSRWGRSWELLTRMCAGTRSAPSFSFIFRIKSLPFHSSFCFLSPFWYVPIRGARTRVYEKNGASEVREYRTIQWQALNPGSRPLCAYTYYCITITYIVLVLHLVVDRDNDTELHRRERI